ncbi:hypothetical protein ACW9HJ_22905 [Nocardia gipuzkoensis]
MAILADELGPRSVERLTAANSFADVDTLTSTVERSGESNDLAAFERRKRRRLPHQAAVSASYTVYVTSNIRDSKYRATRFGLPRHTGGKPGTRVYVSILVDLGRRWASRLSMHSAGQSVFVAESMGVSIYSPGIVATSLHSGS